VFALARSECRLWTMSEAIQRGLRVLGSNGPLTRMIDCYTKPGCGDQAPHTTLPGRLTGAGTPMLADARRVPDASMCRLECAPMHDVSQLRNYAPAPHFSSPRELPIGNRKRVHGRLSGPAALDRPALGPSEAWQHDRLTKEVPGGSCAPQAHQHFFGNTTSAVEGNRPS
jgi:hypothetical protein